jgi:4-hydroxy-tetrahydrodipicolinate reductase
MIAVTVHGAEGRMGRLVTRLVEEAADCELAALISEPDRDQPAGSFHPDLPLTGQDHLAQVHPAGGVIVDFSVAAALAGLLAGAEPTQAALVIGTTGYTPAQRDALAAYAQQRPVVLASNFSVGIPALQLVLQQLARILPPGFVAEEIEVHHRHKLDKPSGTALNLAQTWQENRTGDKVPIHSLRLGGVVGEHSWLISDDEETLQLSHRAHSRRAFLRGVLPAIQFVAQQENGLFSLPEVLAAGIALA